MGVVKQAKRVSQEWVLKQLAKLLPRVDLDDIEGIDRVISLGQRLLRNPRYINTCETLRRHIKEGHPGVKLVDRVLHELSPEFRSSLINNLLIRSMITDTNIREDPDNEFGFRPPMLMVISPTMRCNLKCYGCYSSEYEQGFGMSTELVDRIFTEARELKIGFITISGGEPFIRKDLVDLFEKHRDTVFQVYTNGTLIDKDLAKRLGKMGNVSPMISLEGFEGLTDGRRGSGYFQNAMKAMDLLRAEGVLYGTSICQTRKNYLEITSAPFFDMLVEKGVYVVWFFQYIPIGREPDLDLMPTPEMRDQIRERLLHIRNNWPVFVCDFWNDGPYVLGCIAGGHDYIHINANGDVEPCVFVHFAVDNIRDKSLKEALNSDFFKDIRAHQPWNKNHLCPCMIIDNPHRLRGLVERHQPRPTHPGAETLVNELGPMLDDYAHRYQKIAAKVWNERYAEKFGYTVPEAAHPSFEEEDEEDILRAPEEAQAAFHGCSQCLQSKGREE